MRLLAHRVCLLNLNEATKLHNLEKPLPDARFLAITLIQAALQQILLKFQNFHYHGNKDLSLVNLNNTVELHNLENPFLMQDLWP